MKIIRICTVLAMGTLISAGLLHSQAIPPPAPAPASVPVADQPSREEVIKLMDAMQIRAQLENLRKRMSSQMKQMLDQTMKSQPTMTAEQKANLEKAYDEGNNLYPVTEMMDDMIPIYQKHITKADVAAIITFYDSPAGKHLLTESPAMMNDSMAVVVPKIRARMQTYAQKVQKEAGSDTPKSDAPPPNTNSPVPPTNPPASH